MSNKSGLYLAVIEVTSNCNSKCKHCYAFFEKNENISLKSINYIAEELSSLDCHYVTFSGGEPLLLEDSLFEYAELFKIKGMKVRLTTNGILISKFSLKKFQLFDGIQISLDGPKEIHNKIRGGKYYDLIFYSAKLLKEKGIPVHFLMTINSMNVDFLPQLYEITSKAEIPLGVEIMTNIGRAKEMFPLNSDKFKEVCEYIIRKHIPCRSPFVLCS